MSRKAARVFLQQDRRRQHGPAQVSRMLWIAGPCLMSFVVVLYLSAAVTIYLDSDNWAFKSNPPARPRVLVEPIILPGAREVKIEQGDISSDVTYKIKADVEQVEEYYRVELANDGWVERQCYQEPEHNCFRWPSSGENLDYVAMLYISFDSGGALIVRLLVFEPIRM